jgi:SAM-dependent methyltransferase
MATDWSGTASAYDASFARLCAGAIPALVGCIPASVGRVLDAGTGTGRVAGALAADGHRVTAVDVDVDMVAAAAAEHGGTGIEFAVADLMALPFGDGCFDASVANFVLNHLPVPRIGVRELARVTRGGGTVAVTAWPAAPISAFNALWNDVIEGAGAVRPAGLRLLPQDDFARTADGLAGLLRAGDLECVEVVETRWTLHIAPPALWRGVEAGIATIGTTYRAQDEAMRASMRRVFDERVRGHDELALPSTALLGRGTVPLAG